MALRVLIIDPEISFGVRLRKALEVQNFDVRTVRRPLAALEEIQTNHYDIAVLDVAIGEFAHIYQVLRENHPKLPIIISGRSEQDAEMVNQFGAQAYINKPYIARNLIAIIEWTLARLEAEPMQQIIDQYWEEVQSDDDDLLPRLQIDEPPLPEESTIGEILRSISEQSSQYLADDFDEYNNEADYTDGYPAPPASLPEPTRSLDAAPYIEEPPLGPGDSVASQVLQLSSRAEDVDRMLIQTASAANAPPIRPLPSWKTPLNEQQFAKIEAVIGIVPPIVLPAQADPLADAYEEIPHSSRTQPLFIPNIDLRPEQDTDAQPSQNVEHQPDENLLKALVEAQDAADTGLQEALRDFADRQPQPQIAPQDEKLIEATVDEITQQMGIVLDNEDYDADTTDDLIGDAALRLTQLSLESTAIGTLLTSGTRIVARNGELPDDTWREMVSEIADAWQQGSQSSTRLLYRKFKATGQVLLFSTLTIENLALTMIFSANTALKVIRRQANRIAEALQAIPTDEDDALQDAPPPTLSVEDTLPTPPPENSEPPAAITETSRPTGLRPPDELRRAAAAETPETTAEAPERPSGTYTGYAFLWLVQDHDTPLEGELATAMGRWLKRAANEHEWDLRDTDIQPGWVNVHIEIPVNTSPADAIHTLMAQTETYLRDAHGNGSTSDQTNTLWSESYSVATPGRLLAQDEIERFIRFYTHS